jgi:uncharacterized damage-inducible protein DinB
MQKPAPDEYHPNYQKYFDLVPNGDFLSLLRQNTSDLITRFERMPVEKLDYRYAEGKWTIKEVFMHMIDTERVFAYRALAAARGDNATPVYRMDEELYARNVEVAQRSRPSLLAEFQAVRHSTELLFEHMTAAQSQLTCNITTHPMSARAIGYFLIAHLVHHLNIIEERYL